MTTDGHKSRAYRALCTRSWSPDRKPATFQPLRVGLLIISFNTTLIGSTNNTRALDLHQSLLAGREAARNGDLAQSIALLDRALPFLSGARRGVALRYLAYDAERSGNYSQAASFGAAELATPGQTLSGNDRDLLTQDVLAWRAFADRPSQQTVMVGPVTLPAVRDADGRAEIDVRVGNILSVGLLDTGAERTVISAKLAHRLALQALPVHLTDTGSTGVANVVQLAVLPVLRLGSAIVRNVPVEIADDATLTIGRPGHRQVLDLIIGEATLRTLGAIRLTSDGFVTVDADDEEAKVIGRIFEDGEVPVLQVYIGTNPEEMLFDLGANHTILNRHFFETRRYTFAGVSKSITRHEGSGGSLAVTSYRLPKITLRLLHGTITLHRVEVIANPSQFDVENQIGNAGRDLWAGFSSVTIDYRSHRLLLR